MKQKNRILTTIVALLISATFLLPQSVQAVTKGVDVYEYDNINNYQTLKDTGVQVVIQKATQGLTHNDSLLQYRYEHLTQYGFKIGYYHFADNDGQSIAQAQHFISQIKGLHSDTVYFLDIEQPDPLYSTYPQWTKSSSISFTNDFINYMQSQGYKCGVYTNQDFYYSYLSGNIPDVPAWVANISRQPTQFPDKVSWQYSFTGRIAGVIGDIDLDSFNDNIFLDGQAPVVANNAPTQIIRDTKTATLQSNLRKLLQWNITIDGSYGPQTKQATNQIQTMTGITVDGSAGPQTNRVINQIMARPILRYGSNNVAVRYLQYRLGITADSNFGNQTRLAVIDFERKYGLTVDRGIVGPEVWNELLK